MGMSGVAEVIVAIGVAAVLVAVVTCTVGVALVLRSVRRRYRALRSRWPFLGGAPGSRLSSVGATAAATLGSPSWWTAQRDRQRMWRALSSAEHAVAVAKQEGAPIGDLSTVVGQLSAAARAVDALLRAEAVAGAVHPEADVERRRLESAAASVEQAALASLRAIATAAAEPALSQVRLEVTALRAGLRAAGHPAPHAARS